MSERLHYFTEATTTPVSFDCDASEIDSDLDDLRRPNTDLDRLKTHTRQLQLWSDEARRRLGASLPPSSPPPCSSPHRNTLSSSAASADRAAAAATDRHQSNLSERMRVTPAAVRRSHSAKNLRIRVTPSSSSRSLLSDIESEGAPSAPACVQPRSAPHTPRVCTLPDFKRPPPPSVRREHAPEKSQPPNAPQPQQGPAALVLTPSKAQPVASDSDSDLRTSEQSESHAAQLSRRQSFHRRIKRLSLRRWLRRRS